MRRIAVLTSGGDAPGMNAAIRAVVRAGVAKGWEVLGIRHGYAGLLRGEAVPLGARDVGGVLERGGTMLRTARSAEFRTEEGQALATRRLGELGVDGLVVIGGNGSQAGSQALVRRGVRVVGVASTIDNDLAGVDVTLGVETAADVAREALDRLRVTAASHERAFLVEVMGRECGYLALISAIAGGAEAFVLPEVPTTADAVVAEVRAVRERGKSHAIVVVAEGARPGADEIAAVAKRDDHLGFELRVTRLGHVQRGGAPGVFDRVLGTRLGVAAVGRLAAGASGELVGLREGKITAMALDSVVGVRKTLDPELVATAKVLQR